MNTIKSDPPAASSVSDLASVDDFEIRLVHAAKDMRSIADLFQQVWGSPHEMITVEILMAVSHSGGYVAGAFDAACDTKRERILGASVALLARHQNYPALHSHITGVLPGAQNSGLGRTLKLHQQAWARAHQIEWIVWTFDPLVRRNAWFNIAVLGATVQEYLPAFYGPMTDAINYRDETDRLFVAWNTSTNVTERRDDEIDGDIKSLIVIPTPEDILTIRRTDPTEATRWRRATRQRFLTALARGHQVTDFTSDGKYILGYR